jgi:hypothetical protein
MKLGLRETSTCRCLLAEKGFERESVDMQVDSRTTRDESCLKGFIESITIRPSRESSCIIDRQFAVKYSKNNAGTRCVIVNPVNSEDVRVLGEL